MVIVGSVQGKRRNPVPKSPAETEKPFGENRQIWYEKRGIMRKTLFFLPAKQVRLWPFLPLRAVQRAVENGAEGGNRTLWHQDTITCNYSMLRQ